MGKLLDVFKKAASLLGSANINAGDRDAILSDFRLGLRAQQQQRPPAQSSSQAPPDVFHSVCPVCNASETMSSTRYRGRVCAECERRAADPETGGLVVGLNTDVSGGFVAHYVDAEGHDTGEVCSSVTRDHVVVIDGVRYRIEEARFGGTVTMPL